MNFLSLLLVFWLMSGAARAQRSTLTLPALTITTLTFLVREVWNPSTKKNSLHSYNDNDLSCYPLAFPEMEEFCSAKLTPQPQNILDISTSCLWINDTHDVQIPPEHNSTYPTIGDTGTSIAYNLGSVTQMSLLTQLKSKLFQAVHRCSLNEECCKWVDDLAESMLEVIFFGAEPIFGVTFFLLNCIFILVQKKIKIAARGLIAMSALVIPTTLLASKIASKHIITGYQILFFCLSGAFTLICHWTVTASKNMIVFLIWIEANGPFICARLHLFGRQCYRALMGFDDPYEEYRKQKILESRQLDHKIRQQQKINKSLRERKLRLKSNSSSHPYLALELRKAQDLKSKTYKLLASAKEDLKEYQTFSSGQNIAKEELQALVEVYKQAMVHHRRFEFIRSRQDDRFTSLSGITRHIEEVNRAVDMLMANEVQEKIQKIKDRRKELLELPLFAQHSIHNFHIMTESSEPSEGTAPPSPANQPVDAVTRELSPELPAPLEPTLPEELASTLPTEELVTAVTQEVSATPEPTSPEVTAPLSSIDEQVDVPVEPSLPPITATPPAFVSSGSNILAELARNAVLPEPVTTRNASFAGSVVAAPGPSDDLDLPDAPPITEAMTTRTSEEFAWPSVTQAETSRPFAFTYPAPTPIAPLVSESTGTGLFTFTYPTPTPIAVPVSEPIVTGPFTFTYPIPTPIAAPVSESVATGPFTFTYPTPTPKALPVSESTATRPLAFTYPEPTPITPPVSQPIRKTPPPAPSRPSTLPGNSTSQWIELENRYLVSFKTGTVMLKTTRALVHVTPEWVAAFPQYIVIYPEFLNEYPEFEQNFSTANTRPYIRSGRSALGDEVEDEEEDEEEDEDGEVDGGGGGEEGEEGEDEEEEEDDYDPFDYVHDEDEEEVSEEE